LSRSGTTAVFINQLREKIGVMFGSPETTPGGRALKFYSSVRLDVRRIGALKAGNDTVGNQTKVTVRKNKVAPPFKEVFFDIMYGEGISKEGSILDMGLAHDVVQKSGAWFAYGDERLGQGRENAKQLLRDNDEVRARILADIHEKLGLDASSPDEASADGQQAVEEPAGDPAGRFA
jgi:recombination protein RecA